MPVYMFDSRSPVQLTEDEIEMARMALEDVADERAYQRETIAVRVLRDCGIPLKTGLCAIRYAQQNPRSRP